MDRYTLFLVKARDHPVSHSIHATRPRPLHAHPPVCRDSCHSCHRSTPPTPHLKHRHPNGEIGTAIIRQPRSLAPKNSWRIVKRPVPDHGLRPDTLVAPLHGSCVSESRQSEISASDPFSAWTDRRFNSIKLPCLGDSIVDTRFVHPRRSTPSRAYELCTGYLA